MTHSTATADECVTVALAKDVPEHILVDGDTLCDDTYTGDSRLVDSDIGPLADASLNVCLDCFDAWHDHANTLELTPTVKCLCDRPTPDGIYRCGTFVTTDKARVMRNPDAPTDDGYMPVCKDCYEWIRSRPHNNVEATYEETKSWASHIAED